MNYSKNKKSIKESNNERIVLIRKLADALGWRFDENEYQSRIFQSYAQIKLYRKAFIRIYWSGSYGDSVNASLYVLNKKIRSIGFNLRRGDSILARDIKKRLIFDLDSVYEEIKKDNERKQTNFIALKQRIDFFKNQLVNQNLDTVIAREMKPLSFGYRYGYQYNHDIAIQSGSFNLGSFSHNYDIKLMLSKQDMNIHMLISGMSESTAIKVINLVNKEREDSQNE